MCHDNLFSLIRKHTFTWPDTLFLQSIIGILESFALRQLMAWNFYCAPADHFVIYSKPKTLPLVAFGLKKVKDKTSSELVERWVLKIQEAVCCLSFLQQIWHYILPYVLQPLVLVQQPWFKPTACQVMRGCCRPYTCFDIADKLRMRGWILPAYAMAPDIE